MARPVDVVTVYSPRPQHAKWYDYLPLMRMQRDSAMRFGHGHWVVTDAEIPGFSCVREKLPESIMRAMIVGVVARLARGGDRDIVFVDCDCLINRDLSDAFADEQAWDMILTRRPNLACPVNNGAMYVRLEGIGKAQAFFENALQQCGDHWGADQEAISRAAAPVPETAGFGVRHGCGIKFVDMRLYNAVPKMPNKKHRANPFVIHFKGDTKDWAEGYAARYVTF
jgi:hypothetical protein